MLFNVYCQKCQKDLTTLGGDLFPSGRIYCPLSNGRPQWGCQDYETALLIKEGRPAGEKDLESRCISPNKLFLNIVLLQVTKFKKLEEKV